MFISNLHTHTNYCDGKNTAEEIIQTAIVNHIHSIGISTHGPTSFLTDWNIKIDNIEKYLDEVNYLKAKYKNDINIFLGMEIDYIPNIGFDSCVSDIINRLDYFIGSVHYLGAFNNGSLWTVDYELKEFIRGIEESFKGSVRLAAESYFELVSEMAIKYEPPIIGHLDLFKVNNLKGRLFNENEDWYISAVDKCLNEIKKTKSVVEINTGGMAKGYTNEQYPSTSILRLIKDKDIPVMINTDAHTIDNILYKYKEMYNLLYSLGFNSISYLTNEGWMKHTLT